MSKPKVRLIRAPETISTLNIIFTPGEFLKAGAKTAGVINIMGIPGVILYFIFIWKPQKLSNWFKLLSIWEIL